MAALIWSHFLFNNWFYSTTVLFNCLFPGLVPYSNWFIQLFIPMATLIWSHFFFNFLFLFNLNGRPYLVTLILFYYSYFYSILYFINFFFFFFF